MNGNTSCGRTECELAVPEGLPGSVGHLRGPGLRLAGQDVADWAIGVHDGRVPRTAIGLADQRGATTGQQCAVRASDELVRRETVRSHPERATGTDHRLQYEVRSLPQLMSAGLAAGWVESVLGHSLDAQPRTPGHCRNRSNQS